jgi:alkylated DNA nucleotide flippase Atl1
MTRVDNDFRDKVYSIVSQIPKGRVMTYGQVAVAASAAWAAWEVGQIAHFAPCAGLPACPAPAGQPAGLMAHQPPFGSTTPSTYFNTSSSVARRKKSAAPSARHELCPAHDIPWQRVVNRNGGLARGYTPGGYEAHKRDLEVEGVPIDDDYRVIGFDRLLWNPPHPDQDSLTI